MKETIELRVLLYMDGTLEKIYGFRLDGTVATSIIV